jgi:hypothetical protein
MALSSLAATFRPGHRPGRHEGRNLKGRAVGLLLGSVGKGAPHKALRNTIKAIESRGSRTSR